MIEVLKPYPAYKDSGVEWLGQVPEHWEVRRLKTAVDHINEQTSTKSDEDLYIALEHVESWTGRLLVSSGEAQFDSQVKRFRVGDVLFGKLRPYLAKVVRPKQSGVCVGEFFVLRARPVVAPHYLEVVLRSAPAIDFVNNSTYGAKMPRADWTFVGAMLFPLPPLPEQTAIVRFLDYVDRRIRRVMRARQRRIKLLEEYKQALIHRAVTGQIDVRTGEPYPAYKDSGVEWLGQVPAHWEVVPLKRLAWFKSGAGFPVHHQGDMNAEIPFFKVSDMNIPGNEKYLRICPNTVSMTVARSLGATVFPAGTIIFPKVGGALLTNKRRIAESHCCIDNNMMGCVARNGDRDFLFLIMSCIDLGTIAKLGPVPAISEGEVREIRVALPSAPEQTAIVEYLDAQTTKIDAAIATARREIELLREYRTRLIADVVTGKVDVREVAAQLPEKSPKEGEWTDMEETVGGEAVDNGAAAETFSEEEVER
ncbi:MAG: restriction endonuclease subunit S [Firmicutes bacterium]|nr:restriction endonuclease subunit S [Bacillota bacterium]